MHSGPQNWGANIYMTDYVVRHVRVVVWSVGATRALSPLPWLASLGWIPQEAAVLALGSDGICSG